jgi:hypothetical protein
VQIDVLQENLQGIDGMVLMEFSIPRMGRRIDAVLLIGAAMFVSPVQGFMYSLVSRSRGSGSLHSNPGISLGFTGRLLNVALPGLRQACNAPGAAHTGAAGDDDLRSSGGHGGSDSIAGVP